MTLGANPGSETISKWLLQDMNIINYPPSPQAIITHLWLSAYIPEIIETAQKYPKAKSFSCENTVAQMMAPIIMWCLIQAGAIDDPGAYWNPFMLKINRIVILIIFMLLATPTGSELYSGA